MYENITQWQTEQLNIMTNFNNTTNEYMKKLEKSDAEIEAYIQKNERKKPFSIIQGGVAISLTIIIGLITNYLSDNSLYIQTFFYSEEISSKTNNNISIIILTLLTFVICYGIISFVRWLIRINNKSTPKQN